MASIAEELQRVRGRIRLAELAAGRPAGAVRLVAVSKAQPPEALREAYHAGQRDFGENYAQELAAKAAALAELPALSFHFIGRIQANKAGTLARLASIVHSLDRARVARELGRRAAERGRRLPVLLEINLSGEPQKGGCAPAEARPLLDAVRAEPALRAAGLMTVPPLDAPPGEARRLYRALRELRDALGGARELPELSMGMTHDFEEAIAEGATMVRLGTAIFGARP